MLMLALSEAINLLTMQSCLHLYEYMLSNESGHALSGQLEYQVEGQQRNGSPRMI